MEAAHLRTILKRYLQTIAYFGSEARHNILKCFDDNVARGHDVVKTFNHLVDEWGEADPQDLIAKYHATAGLLDDKEKSRYMQHVEKLQKKFKMEKLSLVGMEETPVAKTTTKENELKTSPEIAIGHEKKIPFKNKTILFAIEIR